MLAHLELGKGPAKRCEVSVDVTHDQVPAPSVPLNAAGEVSARWDEGVRLHLLGLRTSGTIFTTVAAARGGHAED